MEHSKLPWQVDEYVDESGFVILNSKLNFIAEDIHNEDNARFIVTACNEYDTLKAKAEWADEAMILLRDILEWDGILDHSKVRISQTVDKAKELK